MAYLCFALQFVIAVDDENGDEEGDLIMAASLASSQALAFMIRHGSGIISVGMKEEDLERLRLPLMSGNNNEDPSAPAYTLTVVSLFGHFCFTMFCSSIKIASSWHYIIVCSTCIDMNARMLASWHDCAKWQSG